MGEHSSPVFMGKMAKSLALCRKAWYNHLVSEDNTAIKSKYRFYDSLENPIELGAEGAKLSQAKGQRVSSFCCFWRVGLANSLLLFSRRMCHESQ
jgi:hypothetical protein